MKEFIEIYSISLSGKLDEKKNKRSFQDKKVRYSKLLWEVLKPYGNVYVNSEYNQLTKRIYLQYDETDWEFINRIAGYMNALVIPDMTRDNLGLSFGIKKRKDLSGGFGLYMLDEREGVIDSEAVADLFIEGKFDEASEMLQDLLEREDVKGVPQKELEVLNALGVIETCQGKLEEAQAIYNRALELLDENSQLQKSYIAAKLYNNLSVLDYGYFYSEQSIEKCNKAMDILTDLENPIAELVVKVNLLESESGLKSLRRESRADNLKEAKEILKKERSLLGTNQVIGVHAYLLMNDTNVSLSEYNKADKCLKKAEKIIEKGGKMYSLLGFRQQLSAGVWYLNKGDYTEAVKQYRKAFFAAEPQYGKENFIVANLSRNLGAVYSHMDENELSLEYSLQALVGYKSSRSRCGLWGNISIAYYDLEDYENAQEYAFKAYKAELDTGEEKYKKLLKFIYDAREIKEEFMFGWRKD